jgi:pyruvate dehydrogenase E2 component (dihydrolipoamide acetyltransferase)
LLQRKKLMAEIVNMPKLSDTMEEGVVAKWHKKLGDSVEEGDLLCEIETDKATMEYESPAEGVLLKIVLDAGKKAAIGSPMCAIGEKGESVELESPKKAAPKTEESEKKKESALIPPPPVVVNEKAASKSDSERIKASPLAKKMAADKGVDLKNIAGSGPHGRIVAQDLEGATSSKQRAPITSSGKDQSINVSMMRQTIAKRLLAAKNQAPHFYLTRRIVMDQSLAWRARLNAKDSIRVSVNDIVMMAAAKALMQHPGVNASWQEETIVQYGSVHMAMAVALPTGLITPVIRNCDQLGVFAISEAAKDLGAKAKSNQLKPEDYQGGTFTVSNLGMMGIDHFTAIINPPQAAILAVGGVNKELTYSEEEDDFVAKSIMRITLSCDHRVVDGAVGAAFLQTLAEYLEDPAMMLG